MPARRQRPGLGLTVADDAGHEEIRVVERRAEGVNERVPQFAALVDRPRHLRSNMTGDATGERELAKELLEPALAQPTFGYSSLYVPSR